ncbi:tetrapyrrole biosynthesis, uroporphyrinogen III synthase [Tricladium varicosporioides]|nr:tetrapyrrole biosynthesis, uroporphyrinogen III synthase [Hymenoscyphus varicosporioides]
MTLIESKTTSKTPILLLKTKSTPNDGYEEQFSVEEGGIQFDPVFVPVLEHKFLDDGLNVVRDLLQKKEIHQGQTAKYGGMIFTSQRAVEVFAMLVKEGKDDESWAPVQDVPIYTVGPATSRALCSIPQTPLNIFGADTGNGEALAHYILEHYANWYKGRKPLPPLLFLVGDRRRDIIPKTLMDLALPESQRIQVDELVVYGTGVMESFEQDFTKLLKDTCESPMRWVVVFSPTGCEAMLQALGLLDPETSKIRTDKSSKDSRTFVATIGPTTRDFLKQSFNFDPDVCAEKPSPEGIEQGISTFLAGKS